MKPEIKKLWLAALRSGEHKQGVGTLKMGDGFCCLGVLCDLHAQSHPGNRWYPKKTRGEYYQGETTYPTTEVIKWAGLEKRDPITSKGALSHMNDSGNYSFEQIADIIEREF